MNIGIANFHKGWGGQPLQALLLGQALKAAGHTVVMLAPPESDLAGRSREAGLTVFEGCTFRRGFRPLQNWSDYKAFCRCISEHNLELIHCHGSQDTWLAAGARVVGGLPIRLVRTKHNSYPVRPHWFNRRLFGRWVDRLITVAESIRQDVIATGVVSAERVETIHAGLADDFGNNVPPDARKSVREEFGLSPDTPLLILVGRLAPDKGQEVLLRAMQTILKTVPDCHALLIGTGGDYDRQLALAKDLGVAEHVHFTLFRNDIARLTAAGSVAMLAATACDASSTVLKEAMRLGVPVVGTDVGGTKEILDNGRCGTVIPTDNPVALAEAVLSILQNEDPEALAGRVEAAQARVEEEYIMSSVARKTLRVYEAVLGVNE